MRVLNESEGNKDEVIQCWKAIQKLYGDLLKESQVLSSRCQSFPNLKSSAGWLESAIEDLWDSSLKSTREDILDEFAPIDYADDEEDLDIGEERYNDSIYRREHLFDESVNDDPSNWDAESLKKAIKIAELLKSNYVGKDKKSVIADCDKQISIYKSLLGKDVLTESVYSDLVGEPLQGVEQPPLSLDEVEPEGPAPDVIGISNIIHDLIIDENEAIQGYNNAQANMQEFPDLIEIMQSIASEELVHIGELQKALEMVSPNASKIKEGEQEASEIISPETNNYESVLSIDEIDDEF